MTIADFRGTHLSLGFDAMKLALPPVPPASYRTALAPDIPEMIPGRP